jgi:hypothetical protein
MEFKLRREKADLNIRESEIYSIGIVNTIQVLQPFSQHRSFKVLLVKEPKTGLGVVKQTKNDETIFSPKLWNLQTQRTAFVLLNKNSKFLYFANCGVYFIGL